MRKSISRSWTGDTGRIRTRLLVVGNRPPEAMHRARHANRVLASFAAVLVGVLLSLGVPACSALRIGIASYEPGAPVLAQNLTLGQIGWQLQVPVPVIPCGVAQPHHGRQPWTQTQPAIFAAVPEWTTS